MPVNYLNIEKKHPKTAGYVAGLSNFTLIEGEAVAAEIVLTNPAISLYCLDDASRRAIFVELSPDLDLSKVPFVFQAQYAHAQRFIAVPYDEFKALAHKLPSIDQPIFIYTTGRSGSTLLSHAFNELDSVVSMSEIDTITQLVYLRSMTDQRDAELSELLECAMRFVFKPTAFKKPTTYALKLQSEALEIMDLMHATFPRAKNLFLYRDAVGWVASYYRILRPGQQQKDNLPLEGRLEILKAFFESAAQGQGGNTPDGGQETYSLMQLMQLAEQLKTSNPRADQDLVHFAGILNGMTHISIPQILTLWWVSIMEWYLTKTKLDIPVLPLRYAELSAHPQQVITKVFEYCGLPASQAGRATSAFGRDSQAGTALARDNAERGNPLQLSESQVNEIIALLKRHPVVKDPDFAVVGTLRVLTS